MNPIALRFSLALAAVLAAGAARADTATASFQVSANVKKTCTITAAAITVGDYDPIVANATTAATGQGDIAVACTNKLPYTISLGAGARNRTMTNGVDSLTYELYQDSARLTVWDDAANLVSGTGQGKTATVHTVYMSVPGGQETASVGLYTDDVLATVNF